MPPAISELFIHSLGETLLMVGLSGLVGAAVGLPLGLFMFLCARSASRGAFRLHRFLTFSLHAVRSTPSIVLIASVIPLAQLWLDQPLDLLSTIAPLAIIAIAFIALKAESALAGVELLPVEQECRLQYQSTGYSVLAKIIPRAGADIATGFGQALAGLVGYSTLAGAVGGTGLGDLGLRYGYQPFVPEVMLGVVLLLLLLAEAAQALGNTVAWRLNRLHSAC